MNQSGNTGKTMVALALTAAIICAPFFKASANVPSQQFPGRDGLRAVVRPDNAFTQGGEQETLKLYSAAMPLFEGLDILKKIPGSRFAYSVKQISNSSLAVITNVAREGSAPLFILVGPERYRYEFPAGQPADNGTDGDEEEDTGTETESVKRTGLDGIIRAIAGHAEDSGLLPPGGCDKVETMLEEKESPAPLQPSPSKDDEPDPEEDIIGGKPSPDKQARRVGHKSPLAKMAPGSRP